MKKIIILIVSLFLLTGCYNYKELNDLGIVSAFSIDKQEDEFIINAQLVNILEAGENGISESPISVIEGRGKTIFDAARSLNLKSPKIFFISNLEYVLISKNIIENDLEEALDYLTRDTRLPLNFLIVTTTDEDIKGILSTLSQFDINSSTNLSKIIKFSEKRYGVSFTLTIRDLLDSYLSKTSSIIYPSVKLVSEDNNENNTSSLEESEVNNYVILDNLVFYNNNETIKLNKSEKYGYNYLTNHIKNSSITIKCDEGYFSIETLSSKFKYDNLNNNKLDINGNVEGEIVSYGCSYNLDDTNTLNLLKDLLKEDIESSLKDIIKLSKDYKKDFIGVGSYILKNNYEYFDFENKDWQSEGLSNIDFNFNIETNIRKQGNLRSDI